MIQTLDIVKCILICHIHIITVCWGQVFWNPLAQRLWPKRPSSHSLYSRGFLLSNPARTTTIYWWPPMSSAVLSSLGVGSWVESRVPVWFPALDILESCWDLNMAMEAISKQRKYWTFHLFLLYPVASTILMISPILAYLNLLNSLRHICFVFVFVFVF